MSATNDRAFDPAQFAAWQVAQAIGAVRASVERDDAPTLDDLTPRQLRAYAAQLEASYLALQVDVRGLREEKAQMECRLFTLAAHASALTEERDRAEREACGLRKCRDLLLAYLGAGSLVLGRLRGEGR